MLSHCRYIWLPVIMLSLSACEFSLSGKEGSKHLLLAERIEEEEKADTQKLIQTYENAFLSSNEEIQATAASRLAQLEKQNENFEGHIRYLEHNAYKGDINADIKLAESYVRYAPTKANLKKAETVYLNNVSTHAKANLGMLELAKFKKRTNKKLEKPFVLKAEQLLKRDIEQGDKNGSSSLLLAQLYKKYFPGPEGEKNVEIYYKHAIEKGRIDAANELAAFWHETGRKDPKTVFELMKTAANQGHPQAIKYVANAYKDGKGVQQNTEAAITWYKKLEKIENEKGDTSLKIARLYASQPDGFKEAEFWYRDSINKSNTGKSSVELARLLIERKLPRTTYEQDAFWLMYYAAKGHESAAKYVAKAYENGSGVNVDKKAAITWYKTIVDNDPTGNYAFNIARLYRDIPGEGKSVEYWYERSASFGNAKAQRELRKFIADPKTKSGKKKIAGGSAATSMSQAYDLINKGKETEALKLFRTLADEYGVLRAMMIVDSAGTGENYIYKSVYDTHSVRKIYDTAKKNFEALGSKSSKLTARQWMIATEYGADKAALRLGENYEKGEGVAANRSEALKWYEKSADLGNVKAMLRLGHLYAEGPSSPNNKTKSLHWYKKAADLQNVKAIMRLARHYALDATAADNTTESFNWYKKAANLGNAQAQYEVSVAYARGYGVDKDTTQALAWLNKAKESGYSIDRKFLEALESKQ